MVDETDLTIALLAKMTSSDLGQIDNFTERAPSSGNANRLDPMSFVKRAANTPPSGPSLQEQQRILEETNRLAERMHPLPPPPVISKNPPLESFNEGVLMNSDYVQHIRDIATTLTNINETLVELVAVIKAQNG